MIKNIVLFTIGLITTLVGFFVGVRIGYSEAELLNKSRIIYLDAAYALTNYTVHNEVLKILDSKDISSAIDFTKSVANSNKETIDRCLALSGCKELIEPEIVQEAPEILNGKILKNKSP